MASKCYANYIYLVITNNCNTHSYVGRRWVCPAIVYWFVFCVPYLPVLYSTGNCHFVFPLRCWMSWNKIPAFIHDRGVYRNLFSGKLPTQKELPATALVQWKQNSAGTWDISSFMHFCVCSLECCQNRLKLW